ncbi:mitochondrial small ribosomal subunit Rsm22-domain-containing protein [Camillea tinctor]|nr:mitochondrial small ribosomal subunit Rsm22-domain-containing protein [Camillea tinctor]
MLSAARSRRACPKCRLQLLTLFETGFVNTTPGSRTLPRSTALGTRVLRSQQQRSNSRLFSTTSRRLEDLQPEPAKPVPEEPYDIELVVRQARHAFGDTLPKDYLTQEEYRVYERLYGAPLRETRPEDVGMPIPDDVLEGGTYDEGPTRVLLRETEDGGVEEIVYSIEEPVGGPSSGDAQVEGMASPEATAKDPDLPSDLGISYINVVAKNEREFNALMKLQKDFELASLQKAQEESMEEINEAMETQEEFEEEQEEEEEEEEEENEEEQDEEDEPDARFDRMHTYTKMGEWKTEPASLQLPQTDFVYPITQLLTRTDIKHVRMAAENSSGGPGLPFSVATPHDQKNVAQREVALDAFNRKMNAIEADTFMAINLPGMYASVMSILVEVRKRLGSEWITKLMSRENGEGPRVLDVGGGGAGLAAWQQVLEAEWDIAQEATVRAGGKLTDPPGKKTVIVGSEPLRQRISRFLHNTTFLPRLPDYLHSKDHPDKLDGSEASMPRKQFDVIIASHTLLRKTAGFRRDAILDNLWEMLSPDGGVLIVLEKGHPRGFEAVADVRSRLLKEFIVSPNSDPPPEDIEPENRREREPGMIIAPCTNHKRCPMYTMPGLSPGRKDFCHFTQRFIRPPFLQKIHGATHRNHENINFSFIAIQRGVLPGMEKHDIPEQGMKTADEAFAGYEKVKTAPHPLALPRSILPPIKRRGHVLLEVCTPKATIERWTVPRSFSRQAYRDARKSKWGDLWALGAKTRVPRPVRLGKGVTPDTPNDGGARSRRATQGAKSRVIHLNADSSGVYSATERTKTPGEGRRKKKTTKQLDVKGLMKELEEEGEEEEDDDRV